VIHIATQKPVVILFVIPRVMLDFICAASLLAQIVFILSWTNLDWYRCWNHCDVVLLSFIIWLTVSVYCYCYVCYIPIVCIIIVLAKIVLCFLLCYYTVSSLILGEDNLLCS